MTNRLPSFDPALLAERREFFASRMDREGWDAAALDGYAHLCSLLDSVAPGTLVVPAPGGPDGFDDAIAGRGFADVEPDVRLVNGRVRECHNNVARKWAKGDTRRRVTTGYCLDPDGLWRRHSWMTDEAGRVTETTSRRCAYFGVVLTDTEADVFTALYG